MAEDLPPKRKFRIALEEKNTIPKETGELATYISNALSIKLSPSAVKKPKKSCSRLLPLYDCILIVTQSAAVSQAYVGELESCTSHTVSHVSGKATKVQLQAAALSTVVKVVAVGSPAALKSVLEARQAAGKTVLAIDGRTNQKGYNIFHLKSEQTHLRDLLATGHKCLILNRNEALLPQPID